jgi:peptidoglycan/LPS O-acetylase OafA/YrhL
MIDVYRFILALCVVQGHMLDRVPGLAWHAVFSFYVLSGFLMTLVLNESYGFSPDGIVKFAVNRWLRLFPTYYAVIGLTAAYIVFTGPLTQLNAAMALPATPWATFANLSIVNLTATDFSDVVPQRLSPTAWSLGIEMFCYALLAVYFAKSKIRLAAMLAIGIALAARQIFATFDRPDYGFQGHYGVLEAGLIPFALGGLSYFWRNAKFYEFSGTKLAVVAAALLANVLLTAYSDFHKYVGGLYVVAILNVALVPMLFRRPATAPWQKTLGGISYPIFLCHWLVGTLIIIYLPAIASKSLAHFATTAAGSMALSFLLYRGIDRPVEIIRSFIKRRQVPQAASVTVG